MEALGGLLHGEMVALGTLTQLAAGQGSAEEIRALAGFFSRIGLPTCFRAFGITAEADFQRIAEIALAAPYAPNYYRKLDAGDLVRAMRTLDERN